MARTAWKNQALFVFFAILFLLSSHQIQAADPKRPAGINLSFGINYFDPAVPMKNFFKAATSFQLVYSTIAFIATGEPFSKDSDGYPLSLPPKRYYQSWMVLHIQDPPYGGTFPAGSYTCYYDGNGKIAFPEASSSSQTAVGVVNFTYNNPGGGGIRMYITVDDPANYIHNIRVYYSGWGDDATTIYNPTFISLLKPLANPAGVIREINWMAYGSVLATVSGTDRATGADTIQLQSNTSTQDDFYTGWILLTGQGSAYQRRLITGYDGASQTITVSPAFSPVPPAGDTYRIQQYLTDWSQRLTPSSLGARSGGGNAGAPVEYLVELANETGVSPWFNLGTIVNDDYVRQFATYVRDHLNPSLKAHIELSDELWNYSLASSIPYSAAAAMGAYLKIPGEGTGGYSNAYEAYRSVQIFKIFNEVFGEDDFRVNRINSRLVRILSGQMVAIQPFYDLNEAIMDYTLPGAPFNGHKASEYADAFAIAPYFGDFAPSQYDTMTLDQMFGQLQLAWQPGSGVSNANGSDWDFIIANLKAAKKRGLQLLSYEGGFSQYLPNGSTPAEIARMRALIHDPRMRTLITHNLNLWNSLGKDVDVWNGYDFIDSSNYGSFGFMDSWQQDPYADKYGGILDYLKEQTEPPTITLQPANLECVVGSIATFSLGTTGDANYQWQESTDGGTTFVSLSSTTGSAPFFIKNQVQLTDSGKVYRCIVSNDIGSVTSNPATLTVVPSAVAPAIITQPQAVTVNDGDIANFTVNAQGTDVNYQWQVSSNTVGSSFTNLLFGANANSYSAKMSLSDNGELYQCVISNALATVTSSPALLTVNAGTTPPSIVTQPMNLHVVVESPATFIVKAIGSPPLTYQWQKNGVNISTTAIKSTYTTPLVSPSDDGSMFVCIVTNAFGSVASQEATLTVDSVATTESFLPIIIQEPQNQTVAVNQTATFNIVTSGNGLTYQWKKNDAPITGATSFSYTTPSAALTDNNAQFTCLVTNAHGTTSSTIATLIVSGGAPDSSSGGQPATGHPIVNFSKDGKETKLTYTCTDGHPPIVHTRLGAVLPLTFIDEGSGLYQTDARINGKPIASGTYIINCQTRAAQEPKFSKFVVVN